MALNLKSLIGKLNELTRNALESAAGLCLSRTHYDIEVEHYLLKLLEQAEGDFARITRHFGVDKSRLSTELNWSLDKLKTGNARTPALSPSVVKMMTEAWTIGSIDYSAGQVRTGFTILALTTNDELRRLGREISKEFQKVDGDVLRKDFLSIVEGSAEQMATSVARR
jgi:type VI secretion system protein VasG